jgi:cytochrome c-type biogenesis protein CcmH
MIYRVFLLLYFILFVSSGIAAEMPLERQEEELRARNLFSLIRCTLCSGQTIKESNADIAQMLRKNIRTQVSEGKTDQEIIKFLEDKYGESIILSPKADSKNIFLWLLPLLFIGVVIYVLIKNIRFSD